jgi:hypothetical protein
VAKTSADYADVYSGCPFVFTANRSNVALMQERPVYYPVRRIYPYASKNVLCFDNGSDNVRMAALQEMEYYGLSVASGPVKLIQGGYGSVYFAPIQEPDSKQLHGAVSTVLSIGILLQGIFDSNTIAVLYDVKSGIVFYSSISNQTSPGFLPLLLLLLFPPHFLLFL